MKRCVPQVRLKLDQFFHPIHWIKSRLMGFYSVLWDIPCAGVPFYIETESMCKDFILVWWFEFLLRWEHFSRIGSLSIWVKLRYKYEQVPPVPEPCVHIALDERTVYMGKQHRYFTNQNQINHLRPTGPEVENPPGLGCPIVIFLNLGKKQRSFSEKFVNSPVKPRFYENSASNILDIPCLTGGIPSKNGAMCKFYCVPAKRQSVPIAPRCKQLRGRIVL